MKSICTLPSCGKKYVHYCSCTIRHYSFLFLKVNIPEIISGLCVKLQSYFAEKQLLYQENDLIKKKDPETLKDECIETDQGKNFDVLLEKKNSEKRNNSNVPVHHENLDDLDTSCAENNVQPTVTSKSNVLFKKKKIYICQIRTVVRKIK
jgi:hypothetical protein